MGIAEILTLVFVVLKLAGVISWSWWFVFLPEIIAVIGYAILGFTALGALIAFLRG